MNRRGKRLTLGVMVVGLAVVVVLAIANWSTVRDHVEAWHFQLMRKTETIEPRLGSIPRLEGEHPEIADTINEPDARMASSTDFLEFLAACAGTPVIIAAGGRPGAVVWGIQDDTPRGPIDNEAATPDLLLRILKGQGWHVVLQCFPRRAFVIVLDPLGPA